MGFDKKLAEAVSEAGNYLCIGLDPDPQRIPDFPGLGVESGTEPDKIKQFCQALIESTQQYCCAYKPNLAFFEALGPKGLKVFHEVCQAIPDNKIVIADAKRGDIGHTAGKYAEAFFDRFNVDALTLNPLMGMDTLSPYLSRPEKALFVLALTSNTGASDFLMQSSGDFPMLASYIAHKLHVQQKTSDTRLGMVVGATQANLAAEVLSQYPDAPLLIPGIGAQGGSIEQLKKLLKNHKGQPLVSVSRSIMYAGEQQGARTFDNYIAHAAEQASRLANQLQ